MIAILSVIFFGSVILVVEGYFVIRALVNRWGRK